MYVWDTSLTTRGERPRGTRLNLKRIIIYAMTTKTIDVISTEPRYFTTESGCSCPGWMYRGRLRPCKHVASLRAATELLEAQRLHNESTETS